MSSLSIEMLRIIFIFSIGIIDIIFNLVIDKFKCPKKYLFISFLFTGFLAYIGQEYTIRFLCFLIILNILIILGFIDIKYYEISGKSYIFLIIPVILTFIVSDQKISNLLSFAVIYIVFWIFDKFVGIEKLGGADVKIMLLVSLSLFSEDLFILIILILFSAIIFFLIEFKVRKSFMDLQIPLIVSIAISYFITNYNMFCLSSIF